MRRLVTWTAVLALAAPLGCGGNDSRNDLPDLSERDIGGDEIREAPDVAAAPSDERDAYVEAAQKNLDEMEREIDALREQPATSATADELEQTRERAEARLEELKDADDTEWRRIRAELQQMIDDLEERYERATATS